jgi:hypothetical protein
MSSANSIGESVKNKIEDLRDHLFETLEGLRDKENPMEIERAKAVADVARVIVDSAKAENDFVKLTGSRGSGFIAPQPVDAGEIRAAIEAGGGKQARLGSGNGAGKGDRLGLIDRCPDPNCGGVIAPRTNGNGGLRDACDKCGRTVTKARSA